MEITFAPMEGITDDIFRSLHHRFFPGVDRYYTPFLSPTLDGPALTKKDLRQVLPENNPGLTLVPQVLTNSSAAFLKAAQGLKDLGYQEINLNLGCPSGTVTAKGKGSGFLARPQALAQFLDEIFSASPIDVSIKTRLGMTDPAEFYPLLELYNRYPIRELILHPRVRQEQYRKEIHMDFFAYARAHAKAPLSLSGGIAVRSDLARRFPQGDQPEVLMLGRGLVADPALGAKIQGTGTLEVKTLEEFHGTLFEETARRVGSPRNTMFRMKEIWSYLRCMFDGGDKWWKVLRKATTLSEYHTAAAHMFRELPLRQEADVQW